MKNITRQEYEKALNIVQEYRENEAKIEDDRRLKLKETQQERINNCKEHYFLPNGKYSGTRSCTFCGLTID